MIGFPRACYDEIIRQGKRGADVEICGVLGGEYDDDRSRVRSVHQAQNVAAVPASRYELDPEEQFQLIERIEDAGEEIVGFYHSHPRGPPRPSETDTDLATWPGYSYVIVSLDGFPYLGSWRWRDDARAFEPEHVAIGGERGNSSGGNE